MNNIDSAIERINQIREVADKAQCSMVVAAWALGYDSYPADGKSDTDITKTAYRVAESIQKRRVSASKQ